MALNSTGGFNTSASFFRSSVASVRGRAERCAGSWTTSVLGKRSNCDPVWNASCRHGGVTR